MRLFTNNIIHKVDTLNDFNNIDKTLLNENEVKAFTFIEKWFKNEVFVFQSSGSTGAPKQFIFNKDELIWSATQTIDYLGLKKKPQHFFICLDINLVGGAMLLARAILLNADITIVNPSSNPLDKLPINHPYTFVSLVPMQLQHAINQSYSKSVLNGFKNVLLGGAPTSQALKQQCTDFKINIWETYGMTETLSHIALRNIKSTSGFVLLPNNEIDLSEFQTLKVKNKITQKKWLVTNDLAEITTNGFNILGRADFVINTGGKKVNPIKVESQIENYLRHQHIESFPFFIGSLPDIYLGQKVVMFVENKNQNKVNYLHLKNYLQGYLNTFEIPKEIYSLTTFYYTPSQKIDRNKTIS